MHAAIDLSTRLLAALLSGLQALHAELLLFAAFWMGVGVLDEFAVDLIWLGLLACGRARARRLPADVAGRPLTGIVAVFIPAWREAAVIGVTIRHALAAWPQAQLRLYVGCYGNDPSTCAAARAAAGSEPRVRLVVHAVDGPTTKGDCLNRLYAALCADECAGGWSARAVVFHDADQVVLVVLLKIRRFLRVRAALDEWYSHHMGLNENAAKGCI